MPQVGATRQLADFLAKTNYQDLPGPVIKKNQGTDHGSIGGGTGQLHIAVEPQGARVRSGHGNRRRVTGNWHAVSNGTRVCGLGERKFFIREAVQRILYRGRSSWISFLASMVLFRNRAKELFHAVQNLEQMKDVGELADLTVSG